MKRTQRIAITLILFALSPHVFSAELNSTIRIPRLKNAICSDYTGTWVGYLSELKNAESIPVKISLHSSDKNIIGHIVPDSGRFVRDQIWANCNDGQLTNIFWGKKGGCGGYSQEGFLADKNILILKLHYESINEDTNFIAVLKRKDNTFPYALPKNAEDYTPGTISSCRSLKKP